MYERIIKPLLDRVASAVLSVLTMPLAVIIAVSIKVSLGGPVLFKQTRVGKRGVTFTVYKFRTMLPDRRSGATEWLGEERRLTHKSPNDPRHTPLGRFLRKWSLDEIPQFWNVALGQMSLVGPRPELLEVVANYEPWQHRRHEVKPGITGLWQISQRGDVPMHQATDLDLAYIDRLSFWTDLNILLGTVPALAKRVGA